MTTGERFVCEIDGVHTRQVVASTESPAPRHSTWVPPMSIRQPALPLMAVNLHLPSMQGPPAQGIWQSAVVAQALGYEPLSTGPASTTATSGATSGTVSGDSLASVPGSTSVTSSTSLTSSTSSTSVGSTSGARSESAASWATSAWVAASGASAGGASTPTSLTSNAATTSVWAGTGVGEASCGEHAATAAAQTRSHEVRNFQSIYRSPVSRLVKHCVVGTGHACGWAGSMRRTQRKPAQDRAS